MYAAIIAAVMYAAVVAADMYAPVAAAVMYGQQPLQDATLSNKTTSTNKELGIIVIESAHKHTLQNIAVFSGTPHTRNNKGVMPIKR
jgi:hypothetical protein